MYLGHPLCLPIFLFLLFLLVPKIFIMVIAFILIPFIF
jgi:hypothetical protein